MLPCHPWLFGLNELNVLVSDASYKHTLGIVRSLGQKGIRVTLIGSSSCDLALYSRYCTQAEMAPLPDQDPIGFSSRVLQLVSERHFDLVLPVSYAATLAMAVQEPDLRRFSRVELVDDERVRFAASKQRIQELASTLKIPVPAAYYPATLDDVERYQPESGYPVVVKATCESPGVTVRYAHHAEQLVSICRQWIESRPGGSLPMIQEFVPGYGCGFFALYQDGVCKRIFMHRRVRENPPSGGASCCAESFYDAKLKEYGLRLLDRLQWHGVAMVEFRYDTNHHDYRLLEINPKFWGSLDLAIACGVDFPYYICQMAEGRQIEYGEHYERGRRFHWPFSGELQHCWSRPASLPAVLADCLNPRVKSNIRLNDLGPNWREAQAACLSLWRRIGEN